ncbi:hypothetical protein HL658_03565 [Azospirillum sp. RWY-5-1]|uniref:DUF2384 domain-containing protein n=1 Tax=Azospirillum oleiclasticum TaxID=2735135 RepID=A0ABX2T393_9PROT|nr:hypothetical protein [Azospirillum oleiclasticum]NYZ11615.1 hypothetical protein [Azospirillum oleiclasticum]NYZ18776.1 hypothetical protein [Azospirillum oleiclasticum]
MSTSLHLDRLFDRYINKPHSIARLISISESLPARWNPEQEAQYREEIVCLLTAFLNIVLDQEMAERASAFRGRFTEADICEVKRFVVYVIFLSLPNEDWPQPVIWDSAAGRPMVNHLDNTLEFAEELVLTLLDRRRSGKA